MTKITLVSNVEDVSITNPQLNDTLLYSGGTWYNRPVPSTSGGVGGGHVIEDEGTPLTQRSKLNFVGAGVTVTDNAGSDTTIVTISGVASSGGGSTTLSGLLDVNITGVNDFDFLHFNSATAKWEDFPSQFKPSVYIASTTNLTLSGTYYTQSLPIDPGDRILAAGQLTSADNGIYIASEGAWQRAPDSDTWDKISEMYVWSYTGTWARTWWLCENDRVGTLGVTPISYIRIGRQNPGDMLKSTYDADNNGIVDQAAAVPWEGITSKPNVISGIQLTGTNQAQEPKLNFVGTGSVTVTMADDAPNTRTTITISGSSSGSGDMLKSVYDTNNDGVVDNASTVPWTGVIGKPSTVISGVQNVSDAFGTGTDYPGRGILRFQSGVQAAATSNPSIVTIINSKPGHLMHYSGAQTTSYDSLNVMGDVFLGVWPGLASMQTLYVPSGLHGVMYSGIIQPYEPKIDFTGNLTVIDDPANRKSIVTVPTTIPWDNVTGKPLFDVYFRDLTSTVSGYAQLITTPPTGTENDDSVSVVVGDGEKLIEAYIMDSTSPTKIDAGTWQFNFWASVSSTAGTSQLVFHVYKRTSGGSETEFFNVASDAITGTSVTAMNILTSQADCVLGTDKLVVKVYAKTNSAAAKTVHFYHDGTAHNSHFHTAGFATTSVGHIIQDEGIDLPTRTKVDYVGSGVTAYDDAANDRTIIVISGGGGGGALATLSDVNVAGVADTQLLQYDSGTGKWVPGNKTLFTLGDTFIVDPQPGDVLTMDDNAIYWINRPPSGTIVASGTAIRQTYTEALTGTNNFSTSKIFVTDSLRVYLNGLRQESSYITPYVGNSGFSTSFSLVAGDVLRADYEYTLSGTASVTNLMIQKDGAPLPLHSNLNFVGENLTVVESGTDAIMVYSNSINRSWMGI